MADPTTPTANPPATSGGISEERLQAMLDAAVGRATKPLQEKIDTLSTALQSVQESAGKTPKAEDVAKLVSDQLAKQQADKAAADASSAKKSEARKKVIEARLKGVPEALINLPDTDDEAALTAAADNVRKSIEGLPGVKIADVGGTANDGGKTPAAEPPPKYTPGNSGLTEGQATLANAIKLPA